MSYKPSQAPGTPTLLMSKESSAVRVETFRLDRVRDSLYSVEDHWDEINDQLDALKIGRKDEFSVTVRDNIITAYEYLDELLLVGLAPFSEEGIMGMLALNNLVHYGHDEGLRREYVGAIRATAEKFEQNIVPIKNWYQRHIKRGDKPLKISAEVYVSILGQPQLFIEGNHRTGNLIANWINMYHGLSPFVLSAQNAIAYFAPSAEIKFFADKSSWRGQMKLPKYNKKFLEFLQAHIDKKYLKK